jgi:hypothetical protein
MLRGGGGASSLGERLADDLCSFARAQIVAASLGNTIKDIDSR